MKFNEVINKIMPEANGSTDEPIIIYRDKDGEWHGEFVYRDISGDWQGDLTLNEHGEISTWVKDIEKRDPFAITVTGKDFAQGSAPYVYDKVLIARLRAEYDYNYDAKAGIITGAAHEEAKALINFFEDNIGAFSHKATNYLTTLERPLAALGEMCPFSLTTENEGWDYDEENANEAIERIENEVNDRLGSYPDEFVPEKRIINGYQEKHSIRIAGHDVIFAENQITNDPYMVCYRRQSNVLFAEYYNICKTDDYVEAINLFADGIKSFAQIVENERADFEYPAQTLTAADCIPGSLDENLEGKLILIKRETFSPEYQRSEYQLKVCTGGFGASPNSRGNAVFCKSLYSGKESRYERYDVAGVIDPAKLPEWAKKKIALMETSDEPKSKSAQKTQPLKPSLSSRIEKGKQKARKADNGKDKLVKPKNHNKGVDD